VLAVGVTCKLPVALTDVPLILHDGAFVQIQLKVALEGGTIIAGLAVKLLHWGARTVTEVEPVLPAESIAVTVVVPGVDATPEKTFSVPVPELVIV
jgi:hypothetical protein